MKKSIIICVILSACAGTTDAGSGLQRLTSEPKTCEYLYTLNSNVTTYSMSDAYEYLEKMILDQEKIGDSYYITKTDTIENPGAIFGPKNSFKFKVKVYNCTQ